jgi:acyl carrier protein
LSSAEKLQQSFRNGLALPSKFDVTQAENSRLRQWDSVAHLQLVAAIEDAFGIQMDPSDLIELDSYAAATIILRRHGVWADA